MIDAEFLRECSERDNKPYPYLDPLLLAVVSPIPYMRHIPDAELIQYRLVSGQYAKPEVVDVTSIDCLVGRVTTGTGASYIVERETVVGQVDMLDVTVNPD